MSREYIKLYCDKIDIGCIAVFVIPSLRVIKSYIEKSVTYNVQPRFIPLLVAVSNVDKNMLELSKSSIIDKHQHLHFFTFNTVLV